MIHHTRAHDARPIAAACGRVAHYMPARSTGYAGSIDGRVTPKGWGGAGPYGAAGSAARRGEFSRGQLCRARHFAACARPAVTRTTTAQLGKPLVRKNGAQGTPTIGGGKEALMKSDELARIDALIGNLPAELRETLVLRELEELSYREIAQVTSVPTGTVMSRLWRARRMLARAVAGEAKR